MNDKIGNRCKILISKKIADSLSKHEEKELLQYMISNKYSKMYYTELKKVWDITGIFGLADNFKIDLNKEWEKLVMILK